MKNKNLNEIAKIEKAIKQKYGADAIRNPKSGWTKEKERKYLKDLRQFYEQKQKDECSVQVGEGVFIRDKKQTKKQEQICNVCSSYSVSHIDDVYMTKFECCFNCYTQYIEGREERWKSGWRPNS
tara:strand:- start:25 stop:399 length:375 start_codon:yes stop_codon:yes gene_type:complete